jgi:FtsP/CotA-like multicopper oxidase with cupredoxin domain
MKRTALLAVTAFLLVAGSATAAPQAIKGVVVARHAGKGTIVLATGRKGLGVTVHAATGKVRLGDKVSVVGTRLGNGTIRSAHLHVLSHVKKTTIRAVVVKRLAHSLRVATGHSLLTIHTSRRALASHHDGAMLAGEIGEFKVEVGHDGLVEDDVTAVSPSGTVEIEGHVVTVSPFVVSIEGLPIEITVPSGVTLPALTPGQEVELVVQTGTGNTFTLVSIQSGDDENENDNEVEAKGVVTDSSASQITIDTGEGTLTFAAPAGETLPVIATGTVVEARGVTIEGVFTLTRLSTEDGDGGGDGGDG